MAATMANVSVSDVVVVTSPMLAAAAALGGSWLGSRATLRAQHAGADRQDAREEAERQRELRAAARMIHLELIECESTLTLALQVGARMMLGHYPTDAWTSLREVLARHDDKEMWAHVLNAYLLLRATEVFKGQAGESLAEHERATVEVARDVVRRAIDTLAPIAGAAPLTDALRRMGEQPPRAPRQAEP